MDKKEISIKNILIAKFIGAIAISTFLSDDNLTEHELLDYVKKENYPDYSRYHSSNFLKYHNDWNWLMPIITHCIKNGIWDSEQTNQLHDALLKQNITECWNACVDFVKIK